MEKKGKMSVKIEPYDDRLVERFECEAKRIRSVLGDDVTIEHVGSSAALIGGKNIVDILVGVEDFSAGLGVGMKLLGIGYHLGNISEDDRIFMASREGETQAGDFHVHICAKGLAEYTKMLRFRDYLRMNRDVALEYEKMKKVFAKEAGYDRKKYKELKGEYVGRLVEECFIRQVA